ncbi:MAG: type 4a pilus biogenesis protein PilO [Actinomycetota bacterium]
MKLPKLAGSQQIIVAAAIFTLILIFVIFALIAPQLYNLRNLSSERDKVEQEMEMAKGTLRQLEEAKKASQETEAELLRINRQTPLQDAQMPSLLVQIEDISKRAGIDFISMRPSTPVQKEEYAEIALDIKIEGFFYEFLDFVYRLEKLSRIVNVTSIQIKEGKGGLPKIEGAIKANAYMLTPGVKPAGKTSQTPGAPKSEAPGGAGGTGGTQR